MSRITSLSSQQLLVNQMMRTQQRLTETEIQVTSQQKAQVYSGITSQASRLVGLEVSKTLAQSYVENNNTGQLRLDTAATSITAVEKSVQEFQKRLLSYKTNLANPAGEASTQELQKWAIDSLKDIQSYLNVEIDGQYVFSGTKATTQPVDLGLSTLNNFQSLYDGQSVTYPTTRDAHLQDFSLSNNGKNGSATTDWLTFDRNDTTGTSTVTLGNGTGSTQVFTNLDVGSTITFSNTKLNNGSYTIKSVDSANQITVESAQLVTPTTAQPETVNLVMSDGSKVTNTDHGGITFALGAAGVGDTLTASTAGSLAGFAAGQEITIAGSGGGGENDKTFTIGSINAANTVITLAPKRFEEEGTAALVTQAGGVGAITSSNGAAVSAVANGGLAIDGTLGTITATTGASLAGINVGDVITLSGTTGGLNDKSFTVSANTGTVITVETYTSTWEAASTSYYNGNDQNVEHRLNKTRSIDLDFNAIDPAIEKAIRAMGIIAQGTYGSAGGLDQNLGRLDDAMFLIEDSLSFPTSGTPPFGTESVGSFETIAFDLGFMQIRVNNANTSHESFTGFIDKSIADIENVNMLEAITKMQNEGRTLEASYQVFAKFQQLSLSNYL